MNNSSDCSKNLLALCFYMPTRVTTKKNLCQLQQTLFIFASPLSIGPLRSNTLLIGLQQKRNMVPLPQVVQNWLGFRLFYIINCYSSMNSCPPFWQCWEVLIFAQISSFTIAWNIYLWNITIFVESSKIKAQARSNLIQQPTCKCSHKATNCGFNIRGTRLVLLM